MTQRPVDEYQRVISRSQTFDGFPQDMLAAVLDRMEERSFGPGEMLIRQDAPGDCLLLLLEGSAAVDVETEGDSPHHVAEVGAGDVIGEMALISGEKRSANVTARGPVRVLALPAGDFHELCRRYPQLAVVLTRLIADRLGGAASDALGGKIVGGFRIVRCIGRGGMAVVYEAVRLEDERRFALKMMSHGLVYQADALRRFREEADLLSKLDHENLCRLHGRFPAYGTSFLVMEHCDGPNLHTILERRVPVVEDLVRAVTGQLARALEYVHESGVIHRDIKPSNVMLTSEGLVKLTDFGVARPTLRIDESTETQAYFLFGTPHYMAPEQFRNRKLDERVDHYALACVTYELLSGRRLFEASDIYTIVRDKIEFQLPPREAIGAGVSMEMHEFLRCNLRPEPEDRSVSLEAQARWAKRIDVAALNV